jgi:hypothetical protein
MKNLQLNIFRTYFSFFLISGTTHDGFKKNYDCNSLKIQRTTQHWQGVIGIFESFFEIKMIKLITSRLRHFLGPHLY